jgi:hypothetical protein
MKNLKITASVTTASFCLLISSAASASVVSVTPTNAHGWYTPVGENNGGGQSVIVGSPSQDGNGSLEVSGSRVRYVFGNLFSPAVSLGSLRMFNDLNFTYRIDPTGVSNYDPKYSPALRLTLFNGGTRDDLIFEQAYQPGGYGSAAAIGNWNNPTSPLFYLRSLGTGTQKTFADWSSSISSSAFVTAVYIGVGGGAGTLYKAQVDDIKFKGDTYDFRLRGAVPEPGTWALMIAGFGAVGIASRNRRRALERVAG